MGTKSLDEFTDSIHFEDVSFKYGDKLVLKNIDLKIKKGEITAIVGMSGAGKSTLVNLIPRFFETTEGTIYIDGTKIRELQLKALRGNIAVVSQHVILFNDTIREQHRLRQHHKGRLFNRKGRAERERPRLYHRPAPGLRHHYRGERRKTLGRRETEAEHSQGHT